MCARASASWLRARTKVKPSVNRGPTRGVRGEQRALTRDSDTDVQLTPEHTVRRRVLLVARLLETEFDMKNCEYHMNIDAHIM